MNEKAVLTPPVLAKRWGVSGEKVRRWIVSGELAAANLGDATKPRFRITEGDAQKFWEARQTRKQQAIARRVAQGRPVKEYF